MGISARASSFHVPPMGDVTKHVAKVTINQSAVALALCDSEFSSISIQTFVDRFSYRNFPILVRYGRESLKEPQPPARLTHTATPAPDSSPPRATTAPAPSVPK
jgi:hypothetical protein